jgi:hypothetical protein
LVWFSISISYPLNKFYYWGNFTFYGMNNLLKYCLSSIRNVGGVSPAISLNLLRVYYMKRILSSSSILHIFAYLSHYFSLLSRRRISIAYLLLSIAVRMIELSSSTISIQHSTVMRVMECWSWVTNVRRYA